ncbi:MAG: amidohydrolase [Vicinamibacterales bacterium]
MRMPVASLAMAVAGAAALTAWQAPARQAPPDLVLYNAKVVTVDPAFRVAEAIAVTGDRVAGVGTNAEMRATAGPSTRMVDLGGHAVIPGLMDNHLHSAGGGPGVDLSRARSLADVDRAVRARVATTPAGGIVVSNSDWHEAQLREKRLPLRDDLDKAAPTHPVVLIRGGHEYVLNSAALRRWNVDERTAVPEGGRITRYPDGRLNGELVDTAKALVTLPAPPARSQEEMLAAKAAEYAALNAVGLTSVRHPGISVADFRLIDGLRRQGRLTMRINALLRPGGGAQAMTKALDDSGLRQGDGDAWLRVGGVKLAVDGGFEGGLMREPYAEPWGEGGTFRGLQTVSRESFQATVLALNERGWRVATHAVGDAAIELVLDAYEAANRQRSIIERRWSIEHAFIGRPDHLPRMRALGVALAVQDHLYLAGPSLVSYWGPERAALTTPVKRYLDAGLPVSSGTDAPVVPYPPLWTLYHFITRDTIAGGVLGADQRITREQALRLATNGNAWLTMEEQDKGSLEPGKLADLVVLSEDPLTCPEERLRDATVLLTIVGGRIVYESKP